MKKATLQKLYKLAKNNKFEFGAEYTKSEVDYLFVRDDTLNIIDTDQESKLYSAYISYDLKSVENLNVKIGLRGSRYGFNDKNYFSPRFQFDYLLTDKLKIKAGYGVHYQFVKKIVGEGVTSRSRDFWLLSEDNNVKVGKSTHYVAGLSYERDAWLINSEIFKIKLKYDYFL